MDNILIGLILILTVSYLTYRAYRVLIKKEIRCCYSEEYHYICDQTGNDTIEEIRQKKE